AGAELDAFFAALALPQYLAAIMSGALIPVVVSILVGTAHRSGIERARQTAGAITIATLGATALVTLAGMLLSDLLLASTAPGLHPPQHDAAVRMAWILWPTFFGATAIALATGIAHSESAFLWPAVVPLIGGVANTVLLLLLVRSLGTASAAVAMTAAILLQSLLLMRLLARGRLSIRGLLRMPELGESWAMLWPLLLSGLFSRIAIVAERYYGSNLTAGTVAEISYASRLFTPLAALLAAGIGTVILPRMARMASEGDLIALGASLARSIRILWIVIAPVTLIGIVVARPMIGALFEGGRFTEAAADGVARLLRIYLCGIAAAVLGVITSRVFYALKRVRLLSAISMIEAVAYVGYTGLLASWLGAAGIAIGQVVFLSVGITWHLAVIRRWIRWDLLLPTIVSAARTTLAAAAGAGAGLLVILRVDGVWLEALAGGGVAVLLFVALLPIVNRPDARLVAATLRELIPSR
ncbi:MAG TPA: lipid II flippase MurJ, partial [Thermoanaerobaculia bacterium]|nr:lipid II flippase MurJ [Thermoanaerobaculia bacterium]